MEFPAELLGFLTEPLLKRSRSANGCFCLTETCFIFDGRQRGDACYNVHHKIVLLVFEKTLANSTVFKTQGFLNSVQRSRKEECSNYRRRGQHGHINRSLSGRGVTGTHVAFPVLDQQVLPC